MKNKEKQELPSWFDGEVYEIGDEVRNPYTGETCLLTAEELSMYDLVRGAEMVIQMGVAMDIDRCYDIMQKGGDWILANSVDPKNGVMGKTDTEIVQFSVKGKVFFPRMSKSDFSQLLVNNIIEEFE